MRTLSDYNMMSRVDCVNNPSRLCPLPTFLEQVQYELHDPKWRPECYFNSTVRPHLPQPAHAYTVSLPPPSAAPTAPFYFFWLRRVQSMASCQ